MSRSAGSRLRLAAWVVGVGILALAIVWAALWRTPPGTERPARSVTGAAQESTAAPEPAPVVSDTTTPADEALVNKGPAAIAGRVVDSSIEPIAGAPVTAEVTGVARDVARLFKGLTPPRQETLSDALGQFTLTVPYAELDYLVRAKAEGYIGATERVRVPEEGVEGLELVLRRGASISGRVVDLDKKPVAQVTVSARAEGVGSASALHPTEADGLFAIEHLEPGDYNILARYAPTRETPTPLQAYPPWDRNHVFATIQLREGEHRDNVEIVLPCSSDGTIEGFVRSEDGVRIPKATVWATMPSRPEPASVGFATTDMAGRFRLDRFVLTQDAQPADIAAVDIACTRTGYEAAVVSNVPRGTKNVEVILRPAKRGSIVGVVLDAGTREPVDEGRVVVSNVDSGWGDQLYGHAAIRGKWAESGGEIGRGGRFEFRGVQPGTATLHVYASGYGISTRDGVTVRANETTEVEILLAREGVLRVEVVYTGPLEGGRLAYVDINCWPKGAGAQGLANRVSPSAEDHFLGVRRESPTPSEERAYELRLQPGEYDVILTVQEAPVIGASYVPPENFWHAEAVVESGRVTELQMDTGGMGAVVGQVAAREGEERLRTYLLPGEDVPPLEEISRHPLVLAALYGSAHSFNCAEELGYFYINGVREGTHTLVLLAQTEDGLSYIRDSRAVEVREGETVTVDFP